MPQEIQTDDAATTTALPVVTASNDATAAASATGTETAPADGGDVTAEELGQMIAEQVRAAVAPLVEQQTRAFAAVAGALPARAATPLPKGIQMVRYVKCMSIARGYGRHAAELAVARYGPEGAELAKALGTQIGDLGGYIVPTEYSAEVIELLRARAVVRRSGVVAIPMGASMQIPRHDVGSSTGYVGENRPIPATRPKFGQITLNSRKLAAVVPISNDLLRASNPAADQVVLDDLVNGMAVTEDWYFLQGQGTENSPRGIYYWTDPANLVPQTGTTPAEIEQDLKSLVNKLDSANIAMTNPVWYMAPRSRNHLYVLREATSGDLIYPELRQTDAGAPMGRLWGWPVWPTTNIPTNLGGGTNESRIGLVDAAECRIGEEVGIEINMSDVAAYDDGGTVRAAFSQDQSVVRAIQKHDFAMRHDLAASWLTGVTWG